MQTQNKQINLQSEDTGDCLSAKELVNRHLQNKDHQISDEDLKKVALDCNEDTDATPNMVVTPDPTSASMNGHGENDTDKENDDEDDKKNEKDVIITPLDVLS